MFNITATFGIGSWFAKTAAKIIMASVWTAKKKLWTLAFTGFGAIVVCGLIAVGLHYLTKRFSSTSALATW